MGKERSVKFKFYSRLKEFLITLFMKVDEETRGRGGGEFVMTAVQKSKKCEPN